jgi:hypothetical protein
MKKGVSASKSVTSLANVSTLNKLFIPRRRQDRFE